MILRVLLLLGLLGLCPPVRAAQPIALVTDENPPYSGSSDNGKEVVGLSADLVKTAFGIAGIPYTVRIFPWARAYGMALKQGATCAFTAARTPEREKHFKWIGPFIDEVWALYGREDSPPLASLQDARGKVIGSNFSLAISKFVADLGLTIEEAGDDYRLNARKLEAGRIDYWLSNETMQKYYVEKLGMNRTKFIIAVKPEQGYLACNLSVPDEVVKRVNAVLQQMHQ